MKESDYHSYIRIFPLYGDHCQWVFCEHRTYGNGNIKQFDPYIFDDFEEAMQSIAHDNFYSAEVSITHVPAKIVFSQ